MIKEQNGMKREIADVRIQIETQNNTIADLINTKISQRSVHIFDFIFFLPKKRLVL